MAPGTWRLRNSIITGSGRPGQGTQLKRFFAGYVAGQLPAEHRRHPGLVTMQERHNPELRIGEEVQVHAPRTRWGNRHGSLHRIERGQRSYAWVVMDGTATRFPVGQVSRL